MAESEVTNRQLANFACLVVSGGISNETQIKIIERMFDASEGLRERWLAYHKKMQESIDEFAKELNAQENDHV